MTHADANTGEVVDNQVPIETVVFDISIYPRAEWSSRTVERYADALRAGEALPAITLESETNRLLDGLHRWKAHQATEAATIEVERHIIPDGVPPKLYAASLSARHGDRMAGDDLRAVARETIAADPEASQGAIARWLGVSTATVSRWCSDISERRRQVRQVKALLLTRSGMTQRQAAEVLETSTSDLSRILQLELPGHFEELLPDALDGLPPECGDVADELREELVFGRWTDDERDLLKRHRAGETIVVNQHRHADLIRWAESTGVYVKVDRNTNWGNPFVLPDDGDRSEVIAAYADHYLPHKPSLTRQIGKLKGKVLGCWCHPEPCHGDVLAQAADQ